MQGDVYGLSTIECNGRQILVEEGLEHDDFVSGIQKCRKYRVLSCSFRTDQWSMAEKVPNSYLPSLAPLVMRISDSTSRSLLK